MPMVQKEGEKKGGKNNKVSSVVVFLFRYDYTGLGIFMLVLIFLIRESARTPVTNPLPSAKNSSNSSRTLPLSSQPRARFFFSFSLSLYTPVCLLFLQGGVVRQPRDQSEHGIDTHSGQ
jgi:hypothetical protein